MFPLGQLLVSAAKVLAKKYRVLGCEGAKNPLHQGVKALVSGFSPEGHWLER